MSKNNVVTRIDDEGIAWAIIDRPDVHNAFDPDLIAQLTKAFEELGADETVRVILLASEGKSFCAGADLGWMKGTIAFTEDENREDSLKLARLFSTIDRCPKPTIALVNGNTFGGGNGLVSACDIAIAAHEARFCLSEVRLGLVPGVISPYVVMAMGEREARRYMLTAEIFDAGEAFRIGMVHKVTTGATLRDEGLKMARILAANGPKAITACKELISFVSRGPLDQAMIEGTAQRIAAIRITEEGQEGLASYFEKRKPSWA